MLFLISGLWACKEGPREAKPPEPDMAVPVEKPSPYPKELARVLEAHGGVDTWKTKKKMSFVMGDSLDPETHTIDLWSRKDRVDTKEHSLGYDGKGVWVWEKNEKKYEGDPVFYHNLMFYFHAMPFVLSDAGIVYGEVGDLLVDGTEYPGIRIGYGKGVGVSPDDNYYLHYDPQTYRMAWLGYTVSYGKKGPSTDINWIKYEGWEEVDGLLLPNAITWHVTSEGLPKEARNTLVFREMNVSTEAMPEVFFEKPSAAAYVPAPKIE